MKRLSLTASTKDLAQAVNDLTRAFDEVRAGNPVIKGDLDMRGRRLVNVGSPQEANDGQIKRLTDDAFAPIDGPYITTVFSDSLTNERVLTGSSSIDITDNGGGSTVVVAAHQAFFDALYAPLAPTFVTLSTNATLPNERVLTGSASVLVTDGGAGGAVTLSVIAGGGGVGDFVGPASSADNNVVVFDGPTGKLGKDSGVPLEWERNGGARTLSMGVGAGPSVADPMSAVDDSVFIGYGAGSAENTGSRNLYIGTLAGELINGGTNNVFIGYNAGASAVTGSDNVAIGQDAMPGAVTNGPNVAIGQGAGQGLTTGDSNTFIGPGANTTKADVVGSIAIGDSARVTADQQCVIGSEGAAVLDYYFGGGVQSALATVGLSDVTFHASGARVGIDTDSRAADFYIAGGKGTGTGRGGRVTLQTAPAGSTGSTPNALVDRVKVWESGIYLPELSTNGFVKTSGGTGLLSVDTTAYQPAGSYSAAFTDSAGLRALLGDESGTGVAFFQGGSIGAATGTSLTFGTLVAGPTIVGVNTNASAAAVFERDQNNAASPTIRLVNPTTSAAPQGAGILHQFYDSTGTPVIRTGSYAGSVLTARTSGTITTEYIISNNNASAGTATERFRVTNTGLTLPASSTLVVGALTYTPPVSTSTLVGSVPGVDLTAQVAALTTAALHTPASAGAYRVSFMVTLTTAAAGVGASSILGAGVNLNYTSGDGATAKVQNVPMMIPGTTTATVDTGSATNTVGDTLIGAVTVYSSTTAMTYDVGYTSVGTTAMQYAVRVRVERL